MEKRYKFNGAAKFAPFLIVLVAISSVTPYLIIPTDHWLFWLIIPTLTLFIFWKLRTKQVITYKSELSIVSVYIAYNLFSILRGVLIADTYWDWKGLLINSLGILVPLVAYCCSNLYLLQRIIKFYIKYGLPIFFVVAIFTIKGAYGFYLVPISLLSLFLPVLHKKGRWIVVVFTLIGIFADFGARSNVIKFVMPIMLLLIFYFRRIITVRMLGVIRNILFILPFALFYLAITGTFNIFNINDYVKSDLVDVKQNSQGEVIEDDLKADTRTFLYQEVLQTADRYDTWLFGRSPARGNDTEAFADIADITGKKERLTNEAAILNVFTWTGLVGVFIFMLVFYRASYLAITNSNNIYSKMLGVFIAFRWLYSWIEDTNGFTLNTVFLWLMIGLCLSKVFRRMSEMEIKYWVHGMFGKRYKMAIKGRGSSQIEAV